MKYNFIFATLLIVILLAVGCDACAQSWDFVKEKDGIKIFTRNEVNSSLKASKGEVTFKASLEKVNLLVGDAKNIDWWDKNISSVKVLAFERNKFIQYYIIYSVSWPLSNRDLALEAVISTDPVTRVRTVLAKPLLKVVPEKKDLVRIKKYWQKWTVEPLDNGYVHVTLEGFIDPTGNVPSWLFNMFVTETPYNALYALRQRALSNKPAIK
jgi:hypothetical protein